MGDRHAPHLRLRGVSLIPSRPPARSPSRAIDYSQSSSDKGVLLEERARLALGTSSHKQHNHHAVAPYFLTAHHDFTTKLPWEPAPATPERHDPTDPEE